MLDTLEGAIRVSRLGPDPCSQYCDIEPTSDYFAGRAAEELTTDPEFPISRRVIIPPNPTSDEFLPYWETQYKGLGRPIIGKTDFWRQTLLRMFHRMMGKGIDDFIKSDAVEIRKEEIARRNLWFEDLLSMQIDLSAMIKFFIGKVHQGMSDESIRAMVWLNSFISFQESDENFSELCTALLVYELNLLHELAPDLEENEFTGLLTPYFKGMTIKSIKGLLHKLSQLEEPHILETARTILLWHDFPSKALADRLRTLVNELDEFKTLREFCKEKLGIKPDNLNSKIGRLKSAGVDVSPLLFALGEKFPRWGIGGNDGTPHAPL